MSAFADAVKIHLRVAGDDSRFGGKLERLHPGGQLHFAGREVSVGFLFRERRRRLVGMGRARVGVEVMQLLLHTGGIGKRLRGFGSRARRRRQEQQQQDDQRFGPRSHGLSAA